MSDLLIKGMDLPKEGRVSLIAVFSDGDVKYIDRETFLSCRLPQKAIEVPTHGRLVDADCFLTATKDVRLERPIKNNSTEIIELGELFAEFINNAPTIIEASKERE